MTKLMLCGPILLQSGFVSMSNRRWVRLLATAFAYLRYRRAFATTFPLHYSVLMLDLNFVRDNLPLVEEKLRQRGMKPSEVLKNFAQVDAQRRQAITSAETMKAQRNRASEEIAKLKKSGQDAAALIAETKNLREQVEELGKAAEEYETRLRQILVGIPNIPHESVPVGKSAEDNVEVRRWGTPPKFDFAPKPHWEIGEQLGVLDLSGQRKFQARALPSTGIWELAWSGRWPTSCSTCTLASTVIPRSCPPSW